LNSFTSLSKEVIQEQPPAEDPILPEESPVAARPAKAHQTITSTPVEDPFSKKKVVEEVKQAPPPPPP